MTKITTLLSTIAITTASLTAPAFAEQSPRVLRISPGMCPEFVAILETWASQTTKHASYAVPVVARADVGKYNCENTGPNVPVGQSYGYGSSLAADVAALEYCDANKPAGYRPCIIVARSLPSGK